MLEPGRQYTAGKGYRYGFNGKENDNEVKGEGNQQDYGMRIYDPRLGKFLSVDPLIRSYPFYSPYHFAGNSPIANVDIDGKENQWFMVEIWLNSTNTKIERVTVQNTGTYSVNNGPSLPLPQGEKGKGIELNIYVRYALGNTWIQEEAGTQFIAPAKGLGQRINAFFSGLRKFGYTLKGNENGSGGAASDGPMAENSEELDIGMLLRAANVANLDPREVFKQFKGKGFEKVISILKGTKAAAETMAVGEQFIEDIKGKDEYSSTSSTSSVAPVKPAAIDNTIPQLEPGSSTLKPVIKTKTRTPGGYSYKIGVFKDTAVTTVNEKGDTIRTSKTIIVPIKPIKERN